MKKVILTVLTLATVFVGCNKNEIEGLERDLALERTYNRGLRNEVNNLSASLETANMSISDLEAVVTDAERQISSLNADLELGAAEKAQLIADYDTIIADAEARIDELTVSLADALAQIEDLIANPIVVTRYREVVRTVIEVVERVVVETVIGDQAAIDALNATIDALNARVTELENADLIAELRSTITSLEAQLALLAGSDLSQDFTEVEGSREGGDEVNNYGPIQLSFSYGGSSYATLALAKAAADLAEADGTDVVIVATRTQSKTTSTNAVTADFSGRNADGILITETREVVAAIPAVVQADVVNVTDVAYTTAAAIVPNGADTYSYSAWTNSGAVIPGTEGAGAEDSWSAFTSNGDGTESRTRNVTYLTTGNTQLQTRTASLTIVDAADSPAPVTDVTEQTIAAANTARVEVETETQNEAPATITGTANVVYSASGALASLYSATINGVAISNGSTIAVEAGDVLSVIITTPSGAGAAQDITITEADLSDSTVTITIQANAGSVVKS